MLVFKTFKFILKLPCLLIAYKSRLLKGQPSKKQWYINKCLPQGSMNLTCSSWENLHPAPRLHSPLWNAWQTPRASLFCCAVSSSSSSFFLYLVTWSTLIIRPRTWAPFRLSERKPKRFVHCRHIRKQKHLGSNYCPLQAY